MDEYDFRFSHWCKENREQIVPILQEALWKTEGMLRLHISEWLLKLNEADGAAGLFDGLQSSDENLQKATLKILRRSPLAPLTAQSPFWKEPPFPISREDLLIALELFFYRSEFDVGHTAIEIAFEMELPQANERMVKLLQSDTTRFIGVAHKLLERGVDEGAFAIVEELYREREDQSYCPLSEKAVKNAAPALALKAGDLLTHYVLNNLEKSDNSTANAISNALSGLQHAKHPNEAKVLKRLLESPAKWWVRGKALKRLGELEKEAGLKRLQQALADPLLRKDAAEGIANIARKQTTTVEQHKTELLTALTTALGDTANKDTIGKILDAIITLGGDVVAIVENYDLEMDRFDRMKIGWVKDGITPKIAAQALLEGNVIDPLDESTLNEMEDDWNHRYQPSSILWSLLSYSMRLMAFDCETCDRYPDHADLVKDILVCMNTDDFQPKAISQRWLVEDENGEGDEDARFEMEMLYDQKIYRFNFEYGGSWYSVDSLLEGLNAVLETARHPKRFFEICTSDQCVTLTFAPAEFPILAQQLHIPLE